MIRTSAALILSTLVFVVAGVHPLGAADASNEEESTGGPTALAETYVLTLSLDDGGSSSAFSMTVASRETFSMSLGDKNIGFRGLVRSFADGRDVVEFTLEFSRLVEEGGPPRRSGSTWKGSVHFEEGRAIQIATFLGGSFSVRFDALD